MPRPRVPADDALGAYMPRQRCPHCGKRLVVEMTVTIRQPAPEDLKAVNAQLKAKYPEWDGGGER